MSLSDVTIVNEKPANAIQSPLAITRDEPPIRVMALHALLYCERLFYLEEVEEIRVADHAVYAGRRLHDNVVPLDDETPERRSVEVASERWGLIGKVDSVRRRDGQWIAYEHKRGRCRRGENNEPLAWPSDRIQAIAYAVLLEEAFGEPVLNARVRYHADNVSATIAIDEVARRDLTEAIARAREIRRTTARPAVATNENLCRRCSLAPVCLPEEERLEASPDDQVATPTPTFFPANRERQTLHVTSNKARIGRSGETLVVTAEDGSQEKVPIQQIDAVVIHGFGQMTTQAIHLCAYNEVAVQWMTAGGKFAAGTSASSGRVRQRIRQYSALSEDVTRLTLAKRLVHAKVETQLRYLLRATRSAPEIRAACQADVHRIRESLSGIASATNAATLLGLEGMAAKSYFATIPRFLSAHVPQEMHPVGRSKHPPRDRFNCLLSFGYSLIYTAVHRSILSVGLEPSFGIYHQPRSAAPPLVLDLMELFRTPLWEMPLIGSVNRNQWNVTADFQVAHNQVWLSEAGRKKAIELFETRVEESYKHPHTGQSLTYARMIELEVRLLEKEWSGCPGHFAKLRMR